MSASNVNGFMGIPVPAGHPQVAVLGWGTDRNGDNDAPGSMDPARARQGGGPLLNAVAQTLGQLGLGQPGLIAVTAPQATPQTSGNNTTDSASSNIGPNIDQTLQTFMHALFQSLTPGGVTDQSGFPRQGDLADRNDAPARAQPPAGAAGYTNLVTQLQSFVQSLGNKSNSAASGANDLNSAFQDLTQALGNRTDMASGNSQASLQAFLQDLLQNLQNAGAPPLSGLGNAVKTFA